MVCVAAACGGPGEETGPDSAVDPDSSVDPDGATVVPGVYRETCDGSGGVAVDAEHFVDANDEDQILRVYRRGTDAGPVQTFSVGTALGLGTGAEADLEDLEFVGTRMFAITSHGRKASGVLDRARYKFAAFDVTGTVPSLDFAHVGTSDVLLDEMLDEDNWDTPNAAVIAALTTSSKLGDNNELELAPEEMGTNIEAIADDGQGHLLIGLRNPRPGGAIVVSLANADATVTGTTARFAGATELDLGGLGIRSMTRSATQGLLVIAGPHTAGGPYKLYRWSGVLADVPELVVDLEAPALSAPEAVIEYADGLVQVLFDEGDVETNGTICKELPAASRVFHDVTVTVN